MKVPFDQYQRYKHTSEIIDVIRESDQTFTILEVGANEHKNLEKFLALDKITYLDIVVPDQLKNDPAYIEGDATAMPFESNRFDFVIALDVFEHIPEDKRTDFLNELYRVSQKGVILAAPFNTPKVAETEQRANLYFKTLYGYDYPWLEEHKVNGLPDIDKTIDFFERENWSYINFSHGSLDIWERMTKLHFLGAGRTSLHEYRFTIDDYYNTFLYPKDYDKPSYRNFFFINKDTIKFEELRNHIEKRTTTLIEANERSQFQLLELDFITLSNYQAFGNELNLKNNEIQHKEEIVQRINAELEGKKIELQDKNLELATRDSQLEQSKAEMIAAELDINRLNDELIEYKTNLEEKSIFLDNVTLLNDELREKLDNWGVIKEQLTNEITELKLMNQNYKDHIVVVEQIAQELRIKSRLKKLVPRFIKSKLKKFISVVTAAKDNPNLVKRAFRELLRKDGLKSVQQKIDSKLVSLENTAEYKVCNLDVLTKEGMLSDISNWEEKPLISIVMPVYNVEPKWLEIAIKSVEEQVYSFWELCIVDDCSTNAETISYLRKINNPKIKVEFMESNSGISEATNRGVAMSSGHYVGLIDNDDQITQDALYEVVKAINNKKPDIIYSDEDKIDIYGERKAPFHKPDWSPDLLRSQMYIGHFLVFKKELFEAVKGFRKEFDGSQDYDLILRLTEITNNIYHIPKILYSWREIATSTALNPHSKPYAHTAGLRALNEHLVRVYGEGNAWANEDKHLFVYDARYAFQKVKVSIIIPTKDKIDLLDPCVDSIIKKTSYPNYEIIIVNNNSIEQETYDWFSKFNDSDLIKVIDANYEFNWSKLNNHGIAESSGEVYIFLNNDTIVISEDWLDRLVEKAQRDDVGTVGSLLLYEDNTIQHAGVVLGLGGWADHIFKGMNPHHYGSPFISPMLTRNVLASTGACLAISKKTIDKIGLFDENFIICGSDVELSLRAIQKGLVNIYDPHVRLYHLESKSRSSYIPPIDFELSALHYKPYLEKGDPYYNRNLDLNSNQPRLSKENNACQN